MFRTKRYITSVFVAVSALLLNACSQADSSASATQSAAPALPIEVAAVVQQPVQSWFTYTTRLESPQQIALRPRVSGVVDSVEFVEGEQVSQGQLLFKLDPRPFVAEVDRLQAQLDNAQALLEQARNEAARSQRLKARNAISAEDAESRETAVKQAQASLSAIQAQLKLAQLNLEFTEITSPIDGLISRAEITKGNTVTANQSVLTRIVSNQKMFAYFDIDERTWNQHFANASAQQGIRVAMQQLGSDEFSKQGKIDFIDNQIDPATGTLRVRASFVDGENQLRAGSFARIRVASQMATEQVLIPETALGTDLKNRFVLTVDENNTLQYRPVELGDRYGDFRAILTGLKAGDKIAVKGPARVGPGMPINPQMIELDTSEIALTLFYDNKEPVLAAAQ
ncbi:efflux RND transporter periplasmic adaptor subunit [Gayadomonas joobiniege]|uniref:efflux RND transporter periplasmic adaptor subunit n=1 Tax=Gayadomonas joobiniege TaxID=1234606 RepID=UPI00037ABEE4|nr:efflux RND transporter periplasmic adaptor subunit [Gayadomonas joobiniege]